MDQGAVTATLFDETIGAALRAEHPDGEKREQLAALGLPTTLLSAVALALTLKAAGGDVSAAKFLRDTCAAHSAPHEDWDLAPYTDEELRKLITTLQEDNHDTTREIL